MGMVIVILCSHSRYLSDTGEESVEINGYRQSQIKSDQSNICNGFCLSTLLFPPPPSFFCCFPRSPGAHFGFPFPFPRPPGGSWPCNLSCSFPCRSRRSRRGERPVFVFVFGGGVGRAASAASSPSSSSEGGAGAEASLRFFVGRAEAGESVLLGAAGAEESAPEARAAAFLAFRFTFASRFFSRRAAFLAFCCKWKERIQ